MHIHNIDKNTHLDKYHERLSIIIILLIQHYIIFGPHYSYGFSFPWDFGLTYHALVHWWMASPSFWAPDWIGVVALGYPSSLATALPQYNPLFIVLKIIGLQYSFAQATYVQAAHALLGAVGALVLGRCAGLDRWSSAVFAVCYQGFGGFYSHSSHPDYFRSFSYVPWYCILFYARLRDTNRILYITLYYIAIPIVIYMQLVSGYVGVTIAASIIVAIMIPNIIRAVNSRLFKQKVTELCATSASIICSGIYWFPLSVQSKEFTRAEYAKSVQRHFLKLEDLQGLVSKIDHVTNTHDITMRGLFVSSIVITAIIFISRKTDYDNTTTKLILSSLLSIESVNNIVQIIAPWVELSRFPVADWSPFWCLGLLLVFAKCLKNNSIHVIIVSTVGLICIYLSIEGYIFIYLAGLIIWRISVISKYKIITRELNNRKAIAIIILVCVDWMRVHSYAEYVYMGGGVQLYENAVGSVSSGKRLQLVDEVDGCRPSRLDIRGSDFEHFSWRGFYSGELMMEDYAGGMNLNRNVKILNNTELRKQIQEKWSIWIKNNKAEGQITCISYTQDTLKFILQMNEDGIVVENEIFYPGWSIIAVNEQNQREVIKSEDHDGLRSYNINRGKYQITETFRDPYKQIAIKIFISGIVIWIASIIMEAVIIYNITKK